MPNTHLTGTINFFLERHRIETPLTSRIVRALPADQLAYRPHPQSESAGEVAWTIVRCLRVRNELAKTGNTEMVFGAPPSHAEILAQFEELSSSLADTLKGVDQSGWEQHSVVTANGTPILEQPLGQTIWMFHFDEIHHRGQLSTFLRPLGAKVPSIYGRSGDDPA
jgi:uncharacterized damage-inducible protein DinB